MRPKLLAAAAFAAAVWLVFLHFRFVGLGADAVWFLEPARNLARGAGLVTRALYAVQLAQYPPGVRLPVAPLQHGPIAYCAIGLAYKLFGVVDWLPLAFTYGLTFLTGLLAYRLGRGLDGEGVGMLAALFFWLNPMAMEFNISELTDAPFALLVTAAAACLWRSRQGRKAREWAAAAGLLLGLASCTRLAGQAYWLGFLAAAAWLHGRSWREPAALLGGLLVPLFLLALYNHRAAGVWFYSPGYFLLLWSRTFPGARSSTSFMNLSTLEALRLYPRDILQKLVTGCVYAPLRFVEEARQPYLGAGIAFGLLSELDGERGRFRTLAAILLAPVFAVNMIVSSGSVRYLHPLFPLLGVVAAMFVKRLVEGRKRRAALSAALAALFLAPVALSIKSAWKDRPRLAADQKDREDLGAFIRAQTTPEQVIYTDDPPTVAWNGDRPAVSLTATLEDARLAFERLPPDALLLTSARVFSEDYDPAFGEAFRARRPIEGYAPCADFAGRSLTAELYCKGR